ncbi:thioesterase family protein [Arthrobacter sp. FW306-2-2C-D06B]|uniref:thioesterase family protein n=1 Tax=Arthrobacter sp. FW306-2-2C-D06B TaxID=2879618 RepID=UPI001F37123D|nr:thioesterase family protein [Arthrobacter sp. FW306-2-2C-D06B]UKA60458.1 thioesterase family protein [Arthrobacter sp. FW306-2-2C-D06B]
MNTPLPSVEEITALPAIDRGAVQKDHIDVNGHMTVMRYLDILTAGTITACGEYGLDLSYPKAHCMGLFAVDHHARYLRELRLGTHYTAHVRLLDASEQAVHTMAYLVDLDGGSVSSTLETLLLNVNLTTRRVARFTENTIAALATGLARSKALPWEVRGCGTMRMPERKGTR